MRLSFNLKRFCVNRDLCWPLNDTLTAWNRPVSRFDRVWCCFWQLFNTLIESRKSSKSFHELKELEFVMGIVDNLLNVGIGCFCFITWQMWNVNIFAKINSKFMMSSAVSSFTFNLFNDDMIKDYKFFVKNISLVAS